VAHLFDHSLPDWRGVSLTIQSVIMGHSVIETFFKTSFYKRATLGRALKVPEQSSSFS
jgi:hypothetical protein